MSLIRTITITGYYLKGDFPKLYGTDDNRGSSISLILDVDEKSKAEGLYPLGSKIKVAVNAPDDWEILEEE